MLKTSLSVQKVWGSIPGPVESGRVSPTVRPIYKVSSEVCYPGAKPRKGVAPLVTRFDALPRV